MFALRNSGLRVLMTSAFLFLFGVAAALLVWRAYGERERRLASVADQFVLTTELLAGRQRTIEAQAKALLTGLVSDAGLRPGASLLRCRQVLTEIQKSAREFLNVARALPDGQVDCSAVEAQERISVGDRPYFRLARWNSPAWWSVMCSSAGSCINRLLLLPGLYATSRRVRLRCFMRR